MQSINLNAWFGPKQALKDINLSIKPNAVTAIIGPSGCGKSTFIRMLNRMHELIPNAKLSGQVLLDGEDIYAQRSRSRDDSASRRYGLSEAEPLSNNVNLRQCCCRTSIDGSQERQEPRRNRQTQFRAGNALGRSQRRLKKAWHQHFRRSTTAALHRPRDCVAAGSYLNG